MALETKVLYDFGSFRFDPSDHLLLHHGKPVLLTPKAIEILHALVQGRGRLITKEELMRQVWPDSFVEEANLTVNISNLRKTLGEGPEGSQYIETVPKRGYRFVIPVTELRNEYETAPAQNVSPEIPSQKSLAPVIDINAAAPSVQAVEKEPSTSHRLIWGMALAIIGILSLASAYFSHRQPVPQKVIAATPRRLAILPFRNLSQDPKSDFLGVSLADAVITKLGYVSAVTVRPSYAVEKYRNQTADIAKVASDLNVDTLLSGSFIREGPDLRVSCELFDVKTENILWQTTFDLKYEKLLGVQDQVAQQIIKGLELNLSPAEAERIQPDAPVDPVAYEYYLRGIDLYSRGDFPLAVKMLEKSVEIDPHYALTWASLGKSYDATASFQFGGREQYRKAQDAFEKALVLQPAQIEARIYMANLFTDTGRVEQAVPLLREALKTNPNHAEVHWELGYAYRFAGMLNESATECERARELDPGVKLSSSALNAYLYLGLYDKFLQSLPKDSEMALIVFYRGFGNFHKQDWAAAAHDFDHAYDLDHSLLQAQVGKALSYGYGTVRQNANGLEILHAAENKVNDRGVGDSEAIYKIAEAYALLGDKPSALRVLRHSIDTGFFSYPYFMSDPLLNNIRDEGEFVRLMQVARGRHETFKSKFF
jgi:DNA-binding winged helix-turn-helix (wHTH) protein/TolB-like protein/Tfp pilus assembly protein PilF